MTAITKVGLFAEVLDIIKSENTFKVEPDSKTTSKTKRFKVSADDRLSASSRLHEILDDHGIEYVSAVRSGSSFPSTTISLNGKKLKSAIFTYKPGKKKASDAITTAMQEKASTYVFERTLKYNESWKSWTDMMQDEKLMEGIRNVYPTVSDEWIQVFHKQHLKMIQEFSNSQWHVFDHSGSGSFMDYVTDLVRTKFGITKKDNWDPADMWLIKGSVEQIKTIINKTVAGSKGSQTIQELNLVMRSLYTERKLVGISLKKVSGRTAKWEEYNIKDLTLEEIDEYNFPNVDTTIKFTENMTQDTIVKLTNKSNRGFKFQIKANDSTNPKGSNLKWEATQIGAGAARGGKAQVDMVVQLLKDSGQTFEKSHTNYPKNEDEYEKRKSEFEGMFNRVKRHAETGILSDTQFSQNIKGMFLDQPHVVNSKLMQLAFLDAVYKVTPESKRRELWTDIVFLAIKKGNRFGPFGKLY